MKKDIEPTAPYRTIHEILTLNRILTTTIVLCSLGTSAFFGWLSYDLYQRSHNGAFAVNTDGTIIPLRWTDQQENLQVEAKAHLERFHTHFYGVDASNYERNLDRALWLGDSSVDDLYRQKKSEGIYNRLLQYSLVQKVTKISSDVDLGTDPPSFRTVTRFEVDRGSIVDRYELVSSGKLVQVDRNYPHNPHGLLITDYFENSLKLLQDEN
jgi:hypothetical protein